MIAVGGCYAEAQRERIFELYPFVDVAFGPGSIPHLGDWLGAGGAGVARRVRDRATSAASRRCCRSHRERPFQAWVQVSMGCNSKCAYCIVPAVRGREASRRPGEIVAEVTRLAADGVREVTLLGQNVNSYGRDLPPDIAHGVRASCCAPSTRSTGIERIRFTSPHPKDFRARRDRRDGRVRRRLRARAPAAPVRLDADPEGDAPHVLAGALPDARRRACAPRFPTSR